MAMRLRLIASAIFAFCLLVPRWAHDIHLCTHLLRLQSKVGRHVASSCIAALALFPFSSFSSFVLVTPWSRSQRRATLSLKGLTSSDPRPGSFASIFKAVEGIGPTLNCRQVQMYSQDVQVQSGADVITRCRWAPETMRSRSGATIHLTHANTGGPRV